MGRAHYMSKDSPAIAGFSMADFSLDSLLGGLRPDDFLRDHWQKEPLLVRQALPGFGTWLDRDGLSRLACLDNAESRLVTHQRGRWGLEHGPFEAERLARLPKKGWSLLVSGVNQVLPQGDALLTAFDFLPRARLDDLMVSFAPDGGGVGPHFDSYDVFLIQGLGRRRWEISEQDDLDLVPDAPLRILRQFSATQSWELEPGDMLYLPPRFAHHGVALGDCMTWSVGFRAPKADEIQREFLNFMQDQVRAEGLYADPDARRPRHPGEIPAEMLTWTRDVIRELSWNKADIEHFLGCYLSEPKANVFFSPPRKPVNPQTFMDRANQRGIRLASRSQLLFIRQRFFMNGEYVDVAPRHATPLRTLADSRMLPGDMTIPALADLLYDWYLAGYVALGA